MKAEAQQNDVFKSPCFGILTWQARKSPLFNRKMHRLTHSWFSIFTHTWFSSFPASPVRFFWVVRVYITRTNDHCYPPYPPMTFFSQKIWGALESINGFPFLRCLFPVFLGRQKKHKKTAKKDIHLRLNGHISPKKIMF